MEDDEHPTTADVAPPADFEDTTRDVRLGPGTEVHGYVIDGVLGKGGMGYVYSATHPLIGKRAAIKILKPEVSKSPIIVERFIQEARAVNQIQHPNIIDIFAFGTLPDGRAYHVMDLLVGETLRKRIKRGPLHPSEAASIIDEVASALIAAHDKGFVHRDLKPDNVFLVARDGAWPEVRLLDFGLAKLMPEAGIAPFTTKAGVMLGTPEYMSPEQARGEGVDYRTDVYALGIVTFEILAGQRPFPSLGDAFSTLQTHAEEIPPSIGDLVPDLPPELVQLVDTMLAKEPAARPSLAAVRTVIKRLRTTTLPTRTAAGLEISAVSRPSRPSIERGPEISASRVGAEPVLATLQPQSEPRATQMRTDKQPLVRRPSQPPISGPIAHGSNPDPLRADTEPRPIYGQGAAVQGTNPGVPAKSTHGRGTGRASGAEQAMPNAAASQKSIPGVTPSPAPSASGLAQPGQPIVGTRLGVPPQPKVKTRTQEEAPGGSAQLAARPARSNRIWLVIGALLAIAAGVVLALALVGD